MSSAFAEVIKPSVSINYKQLLIDGKFVDSASGKHWSSQIYFIYIFIYAVDIYVCFLHPYPSGNIYIHVEKVNMDMDARVD
jgi:hypothetical protein